MTGGAVNPGWGADGQAGASNRITPEGVSEAVSIQGGDS